MRVIFTIPPTKTEQGHQVEKLNIPIPHIGDSVVFDSSHANWSYVVKSVVWFLANRLDDPEDEHVRVNLMHNGPRRVRPKI